MLHETVSVAPLHEFVLVRMPPPQETEHPDQELHEEETVQEFQLQFAGLAAKQSPQLPDLHDASVLPLHVSRVVCKHSYVH